MTPHIKATFTAAALLISPMTANADNAAASASVNAAVNSAQFSLNDASVTTDTVLHYSRVALKQFHAGEFDKAEKSFKAVLRADPKNKFAAHALDVIAHNRAK